MDRAEKLVNYQTTNTYSSLNQNTPKTENVWLCCHGIGFLSRYFIRYFNTLDGEKNYIVAPQAPSKYYQKSDFKYVGASWLTKENTKRETKNVLSYLDAVCQTESIPDDKNLILLGFSQGVSVSMRWMASRKIDCKLLIIYAGSIPKELTPDDFSFVQTTHVKLVYGKKDEYLNDERIKEQVEFAERLFGKDRVEVFPFDGSHEMKSEIIKSLSESI